MHFLPCLVGQTEAAHSVTVTLPQRQLQVCKRLLAASQPVCHTHSVSSAGPLFCPLVFGVSSEGCSCSESPNGTNPAMFTSMENAILHFLFLNCGVLFFFQAFKWRLNGVKLHKHQINIVHLNCPQRCQLFMPMTNEAPAACKVNFFSE